ncbi:MAG: hypothetical protein ACWIPJ_07880 [Polaribacter sp.]
MKKIICLFYCIFYSFFSFSQTKNRITAVKDSIVYVKSTDYATKREFKEDFKSKYSGKEFQYTEEKKVKKGSPPIMDLGFLKGFGFFMTKIFPFLLGGIIIYVILRVVMGAENGFWNFKRGKKKDPKKLVYQEEDIYEVNLERLLEKALADSNYRLAIRYYYLSVLKLLSNKKLIEYHKDKTNSEYKFELKDASIREQFSYLSYIYTYVWYGEFPLNIQDFQMAEKKYQSFKNTI